MKEQTMQVYIKERVSHRSGNDGKTVFIGTIAQCDEKDKAYFESSREYKFIADNEIGLGNIRCGDRYEIAALDEEDDCYGYQWIITSAVCIEPVAVRVIRQFLTELKVKGLTQKRISKLLAAYGANTLEEIIANSSALDILAPLPELRNRIYAAVTSKQIFARIMKFLEERKVDCRLAVPIFEQYGDSALVSISSNPYDLFTKGIAQFRTADRIFLEGGGKTHDHLRSNYAVLAALLNESKQNGSLYIERSKLRKKTAPLLADRLSDTAAKSGECSLSEDDISEAVKRLEKMGRVQIDGAYIYLSSLYQAEINTANGIKLLCKTPKKRNFDLEKVDIFLADLRTTDGFPLSPAQRTAVRQLLTAPVSVLTGGPGTGKSTLIAAVISAIRELQPNTKILSCAPTGKAADNMPGDAKTIHKLIAMKSCGKRYQEMENIDIIFVDEASMVDIQLFAELLTLIPAGARLILIGDNNQLPSIEPGQVLYDMIQSKRIHTINLHIGFRQKEAGQISSTAAKIIETENEKDIVLDAVAISTDIPAEEGNDFYFINRISSPRKITGCIMLAEKMLQENGLNVADIQVLTKQKQGELGTFYLNGLLQNEFNPQTEENIFIAGGKEFRLHDRVIHTKNNYDLGVFNGNVGVITEIVKTKEHALTVTYPSGAKRYTAKDLEDLELAYALTIHKSQGSEYRAVIIPVAGKGFSRRLLYTGVTRGKELVLLIGTDTALKVQIRNEADSVRNSRLAYRLRALLPPLPEEEMEQQSLFLAMAG